MQLLRRKFTVEQYHKMVDSGILTEDDRVELIRGEIVEMSPIGTRHAACVRRLNTLFSRKLDKRALIDIQNPVELDDTSEPQPDIALLQPREDFYEERHPQSKDIFLILEVADTTVKYDREVKIPLYAEDNIVEVWLVDINGRCVEVYREPTPDGYQTIQKFEQGQSLSIQAFPNVNITVNEILGL
ncbi:MAG: Uma2 family endonuclease [Kastovskya adunca ATA6-11-RM4]|jgi:Uma2 family endonuclease|nr:Uma2 family endonuclease [Kastovskya adunca ATA6-11-RM4]